MGLKAELRKIYATRRRELTEEEVQLASQKIAENFFREFPPQAGQTIHTFLPILKNREVDTRYIVQELREHHHQVQIAVPVANPADYSMTHFLLQPDTQIDTSRWGIPEPVNALPVPESEIGVVLVPLLVADLQGHRVGYGKGFYDRFLALLPQASLKLGLAFDAPIERIDDVTSLDLVLDGLITPQKVYRFGEDNPPEESKSSKKN